MSTGVAQHSGVAVVAVVAPGPAAAVAAAQVDAVGGHQGSLLYTAALPEVLPCLSVLSAPGQ